MYRRSILYRSAQVCPFYILAYFINFSYIYIIIKDLITIHNISDKYINYKDEHYNEGMMTILKHKTQNEIEDISRKNLDLINRLSEV